jgi:hypothetical protein
MGRLTRDQIVSEGQLLAGRDDNATASASWLQRWLDSVASSWPWPILQQEQSGVALGTGVSSITVGTGTHQKILDNIWLYDSTKMFRRRLRIKHQMSIPDDVILPSTATGTPTALRIFASTFGVWTLKFDMIPDKDYLLTIPYLQWPTALASGSDVPWYPNDETMVQVVAFKNHEFYDGKDSPVTQAAQQMLAGLVTADRMRFGAITGVNDQLVLDPTVFRSRK